MEQSYNVVEGNLGVTLEVEVSEGEIPVGHTVVVTVNITDLSATGMRLKMYFVIAVYIDVITSTHSVSVTLSFYSDE